MSQSAASIVFFDSPLARTVRHIVPAHACMLAAFCWTVFAGNRDLQLVSAVFFGFCAVSYAIVYRWPERKRLCEHPAASFAKLVATVALFVSFMGVLVLDPVQQAWSICVGGFIVSYLFSVFWMSGGFAEVEPVSMF